jgi:hypothetical protein
MAQVTLFPSSTKPINFPEATSANVHQGVLYFRAKREPTSESQSTFQTNLPFLLIEED